MSNSTGDPSLKLSTIADDAVLSTDIVAADDSTKARTIGETLESVQQGLGVHMSASRSILLHLCQRLTQLEASVSEVRGDVHQLRDEAKQESKVVRGEAKQESEVVRSEAKQESEAGRSDALSEQVYGSNMPAKLKEYESVMKNFQNDICTYQDNLAVLSTTMKKEKESIKLVDTKVEDHRQDTNKRFAELTEKVQELSLQLATLQPSPPSHIPDKFTFQTNAEKLSVQVHLQRLDSAQRSKGYTDLQPFTIPDDMKLKVESRIRQHKASKREVDARAAAELADAYRRLQFASASCNNPRLSELHLSLDQCQQEIKRAFQLIHTSNSELYSFCETKAERTAITLLQNELKLVRNRLREIKNTPSMPRSTIHPSLGSQNTSVGASDELMIGEKTPLSSTTKGPQYLVSSQIPVLRVSLLELSRNLNLLKHRWKKHKRLNPNSVSVNPVALKHLEKLVALINDAYAIMAQEPVDLSEAEAHVEKVGRVLGSDFSMQILALLGGRTDEPEGYQFPVSITARAASGEMATALCKYSEAFTDMFFRHKVDNKAAIATTNEWPSEKCTLENVGREVSALARNQHTLETALAKLTAVMQSEGLVEGVEVEGEEVAFDKAGEAKFLRPGSTMSDALQHLEEKINAMSKQFITEVGLMEILRNVKRSELQNASLARHNGVVVGHRYQSSTRLNSPSSSLPKRYTTVENDSSANKILAAITLEPHEDRMRSQAKLDPLRGIKLSGSTRHPALHGRMDTEESLGIGTETSITRIQTRAQMLRPKCMQRDQLA